MIKEAENLDYLLLCVLEQQEGIMYWSLIIVTKRRLVICVNCMLNKNAYIWHLMKPFCFCPRLKSSGKKYRNSMFSRKWLEQSEALHIHACRMGTNLDDAEDFIVSAVFSLAVDEEVIELEYANPKDAQRCALDPSAICHDTCSSNGIRYLPLVVWQLLFTLNEQSQVWDISGQ